MKNITKILAAILALMLLTACAPAVPAETTTVPAEATTAPTTAPTTELPTEPTPPPTTEAPTEAPTEPEPQYLGNFTQGDVDLFTELFKQKAGENGPGPVNYYNRLMFTEFTSPEDVNLRQMFYDQDIDEAHELTDVEKTYLNNQPTIYPNLDIVRISAQKMDTTLKKHLGISLKDAKGIGMESLVYFKDTDCYYHSKGDTGIVQFTILGGKWLEDGLVEIYYNRNGMESLTMTLVQASEGYQVISNEPLLLTFTQEDIDAFTELFLQQDPVRVNYYNRLLALDFEDPTTVELEKMFSAQDIADAGDLTDTEKAFLSTQSQIDLEEKVLRISRKSLEAALEKYLWLFPHSLSNTALDAFTYFSDTDCYYQNITDSAPVQFEITGGIWLDFGIVEVHYELPETGSRVMALCQLEDGSYTVLRNLPTEG